MPAMARRAGRLRAALAAIGCGRSAGSALALLPGARDHPGADSSLSRPPTRARPGRASTRCTAPGSIAAVTVLGAAWRSAPWSSASSAGCPGSAPSSRDRQPAASAQGVVGLAVALGGRLRRRGRRSGRLARRRARRVPEAGTPDLSGRVEPLHLQRRLGPLRRLARGARRRRSTTRCSATVAAAFSTATCASARPPTQNAARRSQRRARAARRSSGLVGLGAAVRGAGGAAIGRHPRRRASGPSAAGLSAVALASGTYWLVHASVDWFWPYPAITAPVMALLGSACAPGGPGARTALDPRAGAAG